MPNMKKIAWILLLGCFMCTAFAQKAPKWIEKQKKAIVTVTTYKADGTALHNGVGFFIDEDGTMLSAYSLFKDAQKATVTDGNGAVYPVERVLGADELYDVIKLKVRTPRKVSCLRVVSRPLVQGQTVYLLPFVKGKEKVVSYGAGKVEEVTKLKDSYHYYKLSFPLQVDWLNAPVLDEEGEVFGLAQDDASGKKEASYAVSAAYGENLSVSSSDVFNSVYTSIGIKKAWPSDREQAKIMTYLMENTQDAKTFLESLDDFVATFPGWWESYARRASHYALRRKELATDDAGVTRCLDKAMADEKRAIELAEDKGDALYEYARLIYNVAMSDTSLNNPDWSITRSEEVLKEAIQKKNAPSFHQLQGDIYFSQGKYVPAYDEYMIVNHSGEGNANAWYMAAKSKSLQTGVNIGEVIQLLDSAVAHCGNPLTAQAAPVLLERIDWKLRLMQYKEAVADYDLYFQALNGKVADNFYYYREQAKYRMDDLDGALADIRQAMSIAPQVAMYPAEEASILIRQKKYDEALKSLEKAIALVPDFAACYRLRGVCYQRMGKMAEAKKALEKAKELGDPAAEKLLK